MVTRMLKGAVAVAIAVTGLSGLNGCNRTPDAKAPAAAAGASAPAPILSGKLFFNKTGELSPELRGLIRRGTDYVPIGGDQQALFDKLQGSMAERRKAAWSIVGKLIAPQTLAIGGVDYQVPLWHTWYEGQSKNPELLKKIDLFYSKLNECKKAGKGTCAKSYDALAAEAMNATASQPDKKNLADMLTDANMSQTLAQMKKMTGKGADEIGTGSTLFSPSFVEHVLAQSKKLLACGDMAKAFGPGTPPPSVDQFSPCMTEFPASAVMIKANWTKDPPAAPAHDTSGAGMTALFGASQWGRTNVPYDASKMYTVETKEGSRYSLRSIHFSTKDTREWIWISLWWDPNPSNDFGADRPASINGVWANYKMCVTTSFNERDPEPWKSYETSAPTLAASLKATNAELAKVNATAGGDPNHLTTWCSNPNIEAQPDNHVTNCIGCHQYAGSWNTRTDEPTEFENTLSDLDPLFPQHGRDRFRRTFITDFAWGLAGYEPVTDAIATARKKYQIADNE